MADKIQMRRDTASNWTSYNPILADGEWGLESDTKKCKIGNGSTAWNSLAYASFGDAAPAIGDVKIQGNNDIDPGTLYPGTIWDDVSWEKENTTRRVVGSLSGNRFTGIPAKFVVSVTGGIPKITIETGKGGSGYLSGGTGTIPLTVVGMCTTQMVVNANVTAGIITSIAPPSVAGAGYTSGKVAVYDEVSRFSDSTQKSAPYFGTWPVGAGGGTGSFLSTNNTYGYYTGGFLASGAGAIRQGAENAGSWTPVTKWRRRT